MSVEDSLLSRVRGVFEPRGDRGRLVEEFVPAPRLSEPDETVEAVTHREVSIRSIEYHPHPGVPSGPTS